MLISEVARRANLPASTLRFYETVGLLPAARTPAGYRDYDDEALERLAVIAAAKGLGLSLEDIGEVLDAWAAGSCARTRHALLPRLQARRAAASRDARDALDRAAALDDTLLHLEALPDTDEPCRPDCLLPTAEDAPPIACSLGGGEQGERVDRWQALLADAGRTPLTNGVRFRLPAARAAELAELAVAEASCCAFFDLRLHVDVPDVVFEVRVPDDARNLLADVFGAAGGAPVTR